MRRLVLAQMWMVLFSTLAVAQPQPLSAYAPIEPAGHKNIELIAPVNGKICMRECLPATKTVYGSTCKEYCLPSRSLLDMVRGWCGMPCDSCCEECGNVRTKNVLMKKVVPGQSVSACVLKDLPEICIPATPPKSIIEAKPRP